MESQRLYYLDWLRVLIILNLIPFHAAWLITVFKGFSFNPQDTTIAHNLRYYVYFMSCFHMHLLFFISGVSTCIALKFRSIGEFIRERVKRLLIPLVFIMVFFSPLIAYYYSITIVDKSIPNYVYHFWPGFLKTLYNIHIYTGGPGWFHLWFVAYLLIYLLLLLPLLLHLQNKRSWEIITLIISFLSTGGRIFLPALLFIFIHITLSVKWPMRQNNLYTDWAHFTYNMLAFLIGYICCLDQRFWEIINKNYRSALLFGLCLAPIIFIMRIDIPSFSVPAYSMKYFMYSIVFGFSTWFWIIALLGLSKKYLNFSNGFLRYFNRASYPIYIIHGIIMPIFVYYIVKLGKGIILEFIILSILSFSAIIICYELVKRSKVTRFLFGMKW